MAQDFRASILAQLNTQNIPNEIKAIENNRINFSNITLDRASLINSIQSILDNHQFNINIRNANIDTNNLTNHMQRLGLASGQQFVTQFNRAINGIDLHNGGIAHLNTMLQGAGFDRQSINVITQDLGNMRLEIDKIRTTMLSTGNIRLSITGKDELQRMVQIQRDFDKETGNIVNTSKSFIQNFAQQESQLQKNAAAAMQYGKQLASLTTKFTGENSNNRLFNTEHIIEFNSALHNVYNTITQLETATAEETVLLKANIDSQIKAVSLLAQGFYNVEAEEKSGETQLQKNTAAVIKYGDQLSSIITKFTGDSSNSKLFKTEHISEFNASLQSVYQTLTRLETASAEETTILKANIESQIHAVSLLAQSFHNLELAEKSGEIQLQQNAIAAIKYGDKLASITTKFSGEGSNSRLFKEEHLHSFNAALQSVYNSIARLETASSEETAMMKANIDSQINAVSLLAQGFHNIELAERSSDIQLQKNAAFAIQYGDNLAKINAKYTEDGSKSKLFNEAHVNEFNASLQNVYNTITQLETATAEEATLLKANINSQINAVSLLAQGFHNVEVAERSSDAQLKKNAVDVTGYLSKLQSVQSKYSSDSKNPIINPAHLEQINVALDKVINKIVLLENASSSETRTIKSNIDDEINSFNLLIQTLQRAENAERHDAQQLAKNTATISQYKSILEKLSYNAFNENATKPLNNAENIEKLQSAFIQAALSVEQLKNADSSTFTEMKANVDSDINGLKLLITSLQNAEYAASQLRAKPVETIKAEQIELLNGFVAQIKKAGLFTDEFKAETDALRTQLNGVFDADTLKQYLNNLSVAQARYKGLKQEASQFASEAEVSILKNKMETWLNKNSKASKQYGDSVRQLIAELNGLSSQGQVLNTDLKRISNSWKEIDAAASAAGLKGRTFFQQIIGAAKSLTRYFGVSTFVYRTFGTIKNGIKNIVDLDTALVDLKKTTDGTEAQLNSFYESANDIAKQLGVTTKEVISSTAEWSRLGYSLKDAETMAQVSAKFEAISPGVDMEQAQNGLVSAMKANK